ncbi:cordon-bleu protein-like 1 isoform X2 [Conger conger]|uniref:cordon-bleu protein-like 1 isoform X2 n=1 Tax=Conger conger TaxID=82655 RepID=UPI002A5A3349|nr:cordon-bleu protein-like 1 isoform X2 [Conger conger]
MTHTEMDKTSPDTDMSQKENLVEKVLTLGVALPGGVEKTVTIHGSKPVMDLFIILCAKYHLNPSNHTVELISTSGNCIKFKPNAPIETLEVKKMLIKPKGMANKNRKQSPSMPEATVRLVINYKTAHKTVVRVSPLVPVEELMSAICAKCELDRSTTVLLRNPCSEEPLDLAHSLNDFGLREVYAVDSKGVCSDKLPASPRNEEDENVLRKDQVLKEKENKGLFSIFRRSKKTPDQVASVSASVSPALTKDGGHGPTGSSAGLSIAPKKRRAPLPPMMASQCFPSNLSNLHTDSLSHAKPDKGQEDSGIGHGSLKGLKRKAPPPPVLPCISTPEELKQDKSIKVVALSNLEEISEQEVTVTAAVLDISTAHAVKDKPNSLDLSAEVSMDSGKTETASSPANTEIQDTSLKQDMGEEQPELEPESKDCNEETLEVEETHTSEWENTVSADCDSSSAEEGTEKTCLSGENGKTPGYSNEMAISKEEPHCRERPLPAVTEESPAHTVCQNGAGSSPSPLKDSESSSELARQYIPRAGLTTYTIVPSKCLGKLKYFEVALTLEDPAVALKENDAIGSPMLSTPESGEAQVSVSESSKTQEEDLSDETVMVENAVCGDTAPTLPAPAEAPEADEDNSQPSSSYNGAFEAGPEQDVKERKTPPATKPKPLSFRLPQQTRTSVEDVTSGASKSNTFALSHCGQEDEEASGRARKGEATGAEEENGIPPVPPYPPPPPPLPSTGPKATETQQEDELKPRGMSSLGEGNTIYTTNELVWPAELSLEKLTSLATPKPYKTVEPSTFSKAVFTVSKRSQRFATPTQPPAPKCGIVRMSADGEK